MSERIEGRARGLVLLMLRNAGRLHAQLLVMARTGPFRLLNGANGMANAAQSHATAAANVSRSSAAQLLLRAPLPASGAPPAASSASSTHAHARRAPRAAALEPRHRAEMCPAAPAAAAACRHTDLAAHAPGIQLWQQG